MALRWRILLTLIVTIFSIAYVLPSIPQVKNSPLSSFLPDKVINLGLDLKGGINLTLGVEVEKAVENTLGQTGNAIRASAEKEGIYIYRPQLMPGAKLQFTLPKASERAKIDTLLADQFSTLNVLSATEEGSQVRYLLELTPQAHSEIADMALDQAVNTIRSRIDEFGVAEPEIRKQQDYRIQIQLPGISDPQRAIKVVEKTAHLEFRLVIEQDPTGYIPTPDTEILPMLVRQTQERQNPALSNATANPYASFEVPIVVQRQATMTGEYITDARVAFDEMNRPIVTINFNDQGAALFENLTANNVHRRMAIVLDGKVYSAPVINERIGGGRCSISGNFSVEEANDLALVLRAGSLPAPVTLLEERTVGPSLGQDSIEQGINASIVGGLLVVIFMIVYYGFSGFIADIVLVLNIFLIMAGLACFGATLTLPGIAGIILTIGTAVDANVLINERIREELRRGLSVKAAIHEGYSRATLTIIDSHVTSIIAALVLYQFGTGPIRGFAVTMTLGMVASLFTAVFASRVILDIWTSIKQRTSLSV